MRVVARGTEELPEPILELWLEQRDKYVRLMGRRSDGEYNFYILNISEAGISMMNGVAVGLPVDSNNAVRVYNENGIELVRSDSPR